MRGGRLVQVSAVGAAMAMLAAPMAQAAPSAGDVAATASSGLTRTQSAPEAGSEPEPELETTGVEVATTAVEDEPADDTVTLTAPAGELRVVGVTWQDESPGTTDDEVEINYRTHDGDGWSPWEELDAEDLAGAESSERSGAEPVAVIDVEQV